MAIAEISLEGFKSLTKHTFSFNPNENLIVAKNGIGKSSIGDAIAFGYCGTDRHGNKNPTHLINKESDSCKVTIKSTTGGEIVRTLSQKGNGTIKAIRNGIPNTLTQTQLSGLLGPQDVFMSALMPGYFMALTPSKRKDVLNAVLPKLDAYQIVLDKTGQNVEGKYDLSKKTTVTTIAQDRRSVEKVIDQNVGAIRANKEVTPLVEPELNPATYEIVNKHQKTADAWNLYNQALKSYEQKKDARNSALAKNNELQQRTDALQDELSKLEEVAFEEPAGIDGKIAALADKKQAIPSKPSLLENLDTERCLTCGTPVTKKMKDAVKVSNAKALADYEKSVMEVREANKELDEQIAAIRGQYDSDLMVVKKIKDQNAQVKRRKIEIQSTLANTNFVPVMDLAAEPGKPKEDLDEQNYKAASHAIKEYENAKAVYDNAVKEQARKAEVAANLELGLVQLKDQLRSLEAVEEVVKNLANIRLEANKQALDIEGIDVRFEESDIVIAWNGIPYTALSTGQRMRVDFKLCQKINSLMERPINLFFVDDSDLMDARIPHVEGTQVFYTIVDKEKEEIEVLA